MECSIFFMRKVISTEYFVRPYECRYNLRMQILCPSDMTVCSLNAYHSLFSMCFARPPLYYCTQKYDQGLLCFSRPSVRP